MGRRAEQWHQDAQKNNVRPRDQDVAGEASTGGQDGGASVQELRDGGGMLLGAGRTLRQGRGELEVELDW